MLREELVVRAMGVPALNSADHVRRIAMTFTARYRTLGPSPLVLAGQIAVVAVADAVWDLQEARAPLSRRHWVWPGSRHPVSKRELPFPSLAIGPPLNASRRRT